MELDYTYWQEKDGWYLGFFDAYPDWWTQGANLAELQEMLASSYEDFSDLMTGKNTKQEFLPAEFNGDGLSHGIVSIDIPEPISA
jgi:hypothetical protein